MYTDVEETNEVQEKRIDCFRNKGNLQFTEEGRNAEITVDLILQARPKPFCLAGFYNRRVLDSSSTAESGKVQRCSLLVTKNTRGTESRHGTATSVSGDATNVTSSSSCRPRSLMWTRLVRGGENPSVIPARLRRNLDAGFYLSITGKSESKVLHRLGSCYAVLGFDYVLYSFLGVAVPRRRAYDKICKNCAKKDLINNPDNSDGTDTSSSSTVDDQD